MSTSGRHGKTSFQENWLQDPALKDWILKKPDNVYAAGCRFCPQANISLCTMGRQSLVSHMKGKKHRDKSLAFNSTSMKVFFEKSSRPTALAVVSEPTVYPSSSSLAALLPKESEDCTNNDLSLKKKYLINEQVMSAEIKWCLQTVATHKSYRTAEKDIKLFTDMFPDCEIAKKMQLSRAKMGYVIVFGLAPHFKQELLNKIRELQTSYPYVVGFDESLNKVSQRNQMDLNIRYWDIDKEEVCTRYLTSAFLGRSTATNLLESFTNSIKPLDVKRILQVSMDGPSVNFKFLKELQSFIQNEESTTTLLSLGSCGLHTLHNAFKCGILETGWDISKFLRSLYNLFKDVPARRAIYAEVTKSNTFPLKFCPVRWLLNGSVAQRAIDMLPHLKNFVRDVPVKDRPRCASFDFVFNILKDPLIGPKLAFFQTLANDIEPFLAMFQSDKPLAPFLYIKLHSILCSIQERFVKPANVGSYTVDIEKEENLLPVLQVKLGFSTKKEVKSCRKHVTDLDLKLFHKECRNCLKKIVSKLLERSPLKFKLTKAVSCWDPDIALKEVGQHHFETLLSLLVESNWISGHIADVAMRQFKSLVEKANRSDLFQMYNKTADARLDTFWGKLLKISDSECLKKVLVHSLILSHGNANVERGFSINKEVLIENMKEETIIAQRVVYDAIQDCGGEIKNVHLTKPLIHAVRSSRETYHNVLKKRKQEKEMEDEKEKHKKRTKDLIKELEAKKLKIEEDSRVASFVVQKEIEEAYCQLK